MQAKIADEKFDCSLHAFDFQVNVIFDIGRAWAELHQNETENWALFNAATLARMQVNALIARKLSGFACTSSLTMNSKFSIPHSAAECGTEKC